MLIKQVDHNGGGNNIRFGDIFTEDQFEGETFDYFLTNPPFGVDWKKQQTEIEREHEKQGFAGRFGAGLPRVNDGSLLFLQHMIAKFERLPEKKKKKLLDSKTWERDRRLVEVANKLHDELGGDLFEDHNIFRDRVDTALGKIGSNPPPPISSLAYPAAAGRAGVVIMLLHVPQPLRPLRPVVAADAADRPVLLADRFPQFRRKPARRDRARVPGIECVVLEPRDRLPVGFAELFAACGKRCLAVDRWTKLHRLDQVRQRRLRVAGDDEVDVGVALEVLVVRLDIEVGRAQFHFNQTQRKVCRRHCGVRTMNEAAGVHRKKRDDRRNHRLGGAMAGKPNPPARF
jgi:hypothetical protein